MKNNKELKYLNIAKGILIILMVTGHTLDGGRFKNFINLFHMAAFVFISGYLFNDRKFEKFEELKIYVLKKIKTLYLFYLKWEIIFFSLRNIFLQLGLYRSEPDLYSTIITPITSIKDYFIGIIKIIFGMGREPFCGAFWYIISLLIIIIGFSSFKYISRNKKIPEVVYVSLCFIIGVISFYTRYIPRLSPALSLTLIFYIGNISNRYNNKIKFNNLFLFASSFFILFIFSNFASIQMSANKMHNPLTFILCSLCGSYFILFISKKIEKYSFSNIINYIGKNTKSIMALHLLMFKPIMIVQLCLGIISFNDLANLTGICASGFWILLYILSGTFLPLLFNYCKVLFVNKKKIKEC